MDKAGNPLAETVQVSFFVLAGDADRDRDVDFFDFLTLRSNYGQSDKLFSDGDFDYDSDVDFFDFLILRGSYGTHLAPPLGSLFADGRASRGGLSGLSGGGGGTLLVRKTGMTFWLLKIGGSATRHPE